MRLSPRRGSRAASALPDDRWRRAVAQVVEVLRPAPEGTRRRERAHQGVTGEDLALAAELHGVEGWVRRAHGPGVPALDRAVHAALARHQRALGDLAVAAAALDGAGIPFLVVKGPALVATCYPAADLRSYVDLDLVVRPADLGGAVEALEVAGCLLLDANWPLLTRMRVHELRLATPSGGGIDLHWSLGAGPIDADTSPPVERLLARAAGGTLAGRRVLTLGPADTVVHLMLHAAASGGHRLIWLVDVREALRVALAQVPAGEVTAAVEEWGARPAAALMLTRLRRALRAELPLAVRRLTRPGPWTVLVRVVDAASHPELSGTGGTASRLLARSVRGDTRSSVAAAGGKVRDWWRSDRAGPPTREDLLDYDDPGSAIFPLGGRAAAHAFFAAEARRSMSATGRVSG